MYKNLLSTESKKLISNIKLGSILIQFTFLAFPLSMYVVYNKVIISKNPNSLLVVILFLLFVIFIQLVLKITEIIQQNILKTDRTIIRHSNYIKQKVNNNNINYNNQHHYNIADLADISKEATVDIQNHVSKAYIIFLAIYFVLILTIGKAMAMVPLVFFSLNYLVAHQLTKNFDSSNRYFNDAVNQKTKYIKEVLLKIKVIKELGITNQVVNRFDELSVFTNTKKCQMLYSKNLIIKIGMVINILNTSFILIFGRYLYSIGMLTIEEIITCTLLTMWIARPLNQIFANLNKRLLEKDNPAGDLEQEIAQDYDTDRDLVINKTFPEEIFNKIQNTLLTSTVAYCNTDNRDVSLYKLYLMLNSQNDNISYVNNYPKLVYGTILDNITLFDKSKEECALLFLSQFNVKQLIFNLPYQSNYVITDSKDEAIPYDLKISIAIIREIIKKPNIIILDIDTNTLDAHIMKSILKHLEDNSIKLIARKENYKTKALEKFINE